MTPSPRPPARGPRTMYMHTVDDRPAFYSARDGQIVFADILPYWLDRPTKVVLRATVRQITRDQERSVAMRKGMKFKDTSLGKYGYVVVRVPR